MIRIDGLSVRAAGRLIVDDITLRVEPGEVVGLAGRSGSGKTTVLQAVVGYLRPGLQRVGGTVRVCGEDPFTPAGARQLRGVRVMSVPQDPASALNPAHSVRAQLAETLRRARPSLTRAQRANRLAETIDAVRLPTSLLRAHPHELSGGQAQRVVLATALVGRAELVLLDEPTSNLDSRLRGEVEELLCRISAGTTMMLVSHDPDLLKRLAGRIVTIDAGRVGPTPPSPWSTPSANSTDAGFARTPATGAMSDPPLLVASDVVAGYRVGRVLDGVRLTVDEGRCVAVLGESGAGKSTLGRCLAGLQRPWHGDLTLRGRPVAWPAGQRDRDQLAVAYVAQDSRAALNPRESVGTALSRALRAARRAGRIPLPSERELLDLVGLGDVLSRYPGQLSGGERQRVNLARAIATRPQIFICDEVTASLDTQTEALVLDTLDRLRNALRLGVVLITHSQRVAARADDRYLLIQGQLL